MKVPCFCCPLKKSLVYSIYLPFFDYMSSCQWDVGRRAIQAGYVGGAYRYGVGMRECVGFLGMAEVVVVGIGRFL